MNEPEEDRGLFMKTARVIVGIVGVALFAAGVYAAFAYLVVTAIQSSTSDRVVTGVLAVAGIVLGLSAFGWATGLTTWRKRRRAERDKPKHPPTGNGM